MRNAQLSPKEIVDTANRLMVAKRGREAVRDYFAPDYVAHNAETPGGNLAGLITLLERDGFVEDDPNQRELTLVVEHIIADGELVMIHQHISEPGMPTLVFMDLFRVSDGLIAEHWDVVQPIPQNPVNTRVGMV